MSTPEPVTFYDQHPFDWIPADASEEIDSVVSRPLVDLIQSLDVDSLVLDIGCGPGRVLGFLKQRGIRCIGLDRSSVSLSLAMKRYDRPGAVGDNLHLPFADGTADVVISDGVIHHTEDPVTAFTENPKARRADVSRCLQARWPIPYTLQVSRRPDQKLAEPEMVQAFRHTLFSGTVLRGSFPSFERKTDLVGRAKSFLRLFRYASGRVSSAPHHRRMGQEAAGSYRPIRRESRTECSLFPCGKGRAKQSARSDQSRDPGRVD